MTPTTVLEALQASPITLNGLTATATGIKDGKFIVIASVRPVSGHLHLSAEWHYLTAHRILTLKGGAFEG